MGVEVDWIEMVYAAVPGMVVADLTAPGNTQNLIIGAVASAAVSDFLKVDEPKTAKELRKTFKQRPVLAFGGAYAIGRVAGYSPTNSVVAGAVGAVLAVLIGKGKGGSLISQEKIDASPDVKAWVGTKPYGPGAPPAAMDMDVLSE